MRRVHTWGTHWSTRIQDRKWPEETSPQTQDARPFQTLDIAPRKRQHEVCCLSRRRRERLNAKLLAQSESTPTSSPTANIQAIAPPCPLATVPTGESSTASDATVGKPRWVASLRGGGAGNEMALTGTRRCLRGCFEEKRLWSHESVAQHEPGRARQCVCKDNGAEGLELGLWGARAPAPPLAAPPLGAMARGPHCLKSCVHFAPLPVARFRAIFMWAGSMCLGAHAHAARRATPERPMPGGRAPRHPLLPTAEPVARFVA